MGKASDDYAGRVRILQRHSARGETGESILVEASPVDSIWGIGKSTNDDSVRRPARWKGLELLGCALMEAWESLKR